MGDFIYIGRRADFPVGRPRRVELDWDCEITVIRTENAVYAVEGNCTHEGFPLWVGKLLGSTLVCPGHAYRFDIATGRCLVPSSGSPLTTYEVREEGDEV